MSGTTQDVTIVGQTKALDVTPVGASPSSIDGLVQNLAPFPAAGWSGQQPVFPTAWPPTPLPGYQLPFAGASIPWKQWVQVLAVLPFVTDPPPCPVVVSRYPGLTTN